MGAEPCDNFTRGVQGAILRSSRMLLLLCGWCAGQGGISPHFEVASLKPAGDAPARQSFSGGPGSGDPERAQWVKVSPQGLIEAAYLIEPYQISGPAWLRTDRYSVTVKIPPGSTRRKFRQMIANLLAERFSLVFHRVTRPLAAYELALAPGRQLKLSPSPQKEGGAPQFRGTRTDQGLTHYTFTQTSMEALADDLRLMIPGAPRERPSTSGP